MIFRICVAILLITGDCAAGAKYASAAAFIEADTPPPPPRIERVAPRDGYIWAPGYWDWYCGRFHWTTGSFLIERRGAHWAPERWEQMGPRWRLAQGHWVHCCRET